VTATPRAAPTFLVPEVRGSPRSGSELVAELRRVHVESVAYWSGYERERFFTRAAADVWAPVDQVRHLTKSMRAICVGFEMPRLLLLLRFGFTRRPSREYHAFRADYEGVLARGARAGRFSASALPVAEHTEDTRVRTMQYHAAAVERLCIALEGWSERWLDHLIIPHPILGRLTAREMAMFALLHNVHHARVAERRRTGR
jgi:hypothetical protein